VWQTVAVIFLRSSGATLSLHDLWHDRRAQSLHEKGSIFLFSAAHPQTALLLGGS